MAIYIKCLEDAAVRVTVESPQMTRTETFGLECHNGFFLQVVQQQHQKGRIWSNI